MISLILLLDLAGTFVFALSGAASGVKHKLDLFGVLVLAFAAASAGGITRDLLIGALPPDGVSDWRYLAASMAAGLITFYAPPVLDRLRSPVQIFDAAGLALFAVSGATKSLASGLGPIAAMLVGVLAGVGGGILRDVLVSEIPVVLRSEIYAVAALTGAAVVVGGAMLELPPVPSAIAGAVLCFALRLISIRRGWKLPVARVPESK